MAAFGLTAEDYANDEGNSFELWPANWPAFCLFQAMATQWNVGPCGATGMNYGPVQDVMQLIGIKKKHRPAVFGDFQIMESEALKVMAERRPERT